MESFTTAESSIWRCSVSCSKNFRTSWKHLWCILFSQIESWSLKTMAILTPLEIFLRRFTKIHIWRNHFTRNIWIEDLKLHWPFSTLTNMCNKAPGKSGKGGGGRKYGFGGNISKSEGGGSLIRGELNSHRGRGELNSQSGLDSWVLPVFLQLLYFCGNIVIDYSYHYVYSNIFDMTESLTQNNHDPI